MEQYSHKEIYSRKWYTFICNCLDMHNQAMIWLYSQQVRLFFGIVDGQNKVGLYHSE